TALAGEKLKDGNFFGDEIEGIKSAARRASNLTRQLLIFSRRQVWSPRVINLNHVLENMEKMIRSLIKENIGFQFYPDAENPYVYADTSQLEQVLINLAVNARDAMPAGGKLLIKTENLTNINPMEDPVQAAGEGINRSFVLLTVTDKGIGIEESNIEEIFDPFFTTKSLNEGTGLGLATVYGIVKQSGGHIKVSSVPGAGTSFLIYLPQADSKFETVPAETKIPALLAGNETILLVEDEDSVRELVSRYLSRKGYNVLEARNAGEALILFEQHANRVNLLITDILLPFMKGDELAERLRKTNLSLCTLFISGYPLPNRPDSGGADGTRLSWFMQKPFEADEILALVRQIFDNRQ
ncbi:MAG: response regulator, partial [Spirochaetales bacterium]